VTATDEYFEGIRQRNAAESRARIEGILDRHDKQRMPQLAATKIIEWLHKAEARLIGCGFRTVGGATGVIKFLHADSLHGLTFSPDGKRFYPVSLIKEII